MKEVLSFFCTLIFSLLSVLLLSCSDSTPQVSTVQSTVVFDFADEKSSPSLRLSIFAETQGDVHRAGEIRLYHEESGMEWLCKSPQKIAGNDKKSWAGHRNFVSPGEASVPQGRYTLYYDDLSGRECTADFNVSFPQEHTKLKASDFPEAINGSRTEKLSIYDASGVLIYWGERKRSWKKDSNILNDYGTAVKYRTCYYTNGSSVAYLMPEKSLLNDK